MQTWRWADGDAPGFADRVRLLRILGELGARQLAVRAWAIEALRCAGLRSGRDRAKVGAAVLAAAQRLIWARELDELFLRPDHTIAMGGGDCDDLAMVVYAGLRALGIPPEQVEFRFLRDGDAWTHVWVAVHLPRMRYWLPLEPSIAGLPAGQSPLPLVRRLRHLV